MNPWLTFWYQCHLDLARRLYPATEGRYDLDGDWVDYLVVVDEWPEVVVLDAFDPGLTALDVWFHFRRQAEPPTFPPVALSRPDRSAERLDALDGRVAALEARVRLLTAPPDAPLTADEAAAYLRTSVKAVYHLKDRRQLRPLPGRKRGGCCSPSRASTSS